MRVASRLIALFCLFVASHAHALQEVSYTAGACECHASYDPKVLSPSQAQGLLELNNLLMAEWMTAGISCGVGNELLVGGQRIPAKDVPARLAEAKDRAQIAYTKRVDRLKALDLPKALEPYRERELVSLEINRQLESATLEFILRKNPEVLQRPFRTAALPQSCNKIAKLATLKDERKMWKGWQELTADACKEEKPENRDVCFKNRESLREQMSEDKNIACELVFHEWHRCANHFLRESYISQESLPDVASHFKTYFQNETCSCYE